MTIIEQGLLNSETVDGFAAHVASLIPKGGTRKMWVDGKDDNTMLSNWWIINFDGQEYIVLGKEDGLDHFLVAMQGVQ